VTGKLCLLVKALERLKQPVSVCHVKAGAVVLDEVHRDAVLFVRAEANARSLGLGSELVGVGEQVRQHRSDDAGIRVCKQPVLDLDPDLTVRFSGS
jgi:hypothetical protein